MLGKLIKYEWKSTSKISAIILLVIAVVTLIGALGFILPFRLIMEDSEVFEDSVAGFFWGMMMVMSLILYILMLMGVTYGMMIYMGVHFYKTMYSDEGYLTHTLPVTPRQLLVSKTLVAGLWYLLVMAGVLVSVAVLIMAMMASVTSSLDMGYELGELWRELGSSLSGSVDFNMVHTVISVLLACLITPFSAMLMLFGALTIGQLSSKYKALMGILAYFGVMVVNMIVSYIVQLIFTFGRVLGSLGSPDAYASTNVAGTYDSAILVALIMGTGMFIISHYILTKKLNME